MSSLIDRGSDTWRAIEAFAKADIEKSRVIIERAGTGRADTENARGRISALRDLLKQAEPPGKAGGPPPTPTPRYT